MFCRNLNALLVTKRRKQWLTSLASAQLTRKSGQTTSIHTTQIPTKYLTKKASPALLDMLGLCNL